MADERWSRLIDEHQRNAARLASDRGAPPPRWGLPLGLLAPWVPLAIVWVRPSALLALAAWSVLLIPVAGLTCLFLRRWQTVTVGLVLGTFGVLLAAPPLLIR